MRHLAATIVLLIPSLGLTAPARAAISLCGPQDEVGRFERADFAIDLERQYKNSFDPCEVALDVMITDPDGQTITLPAFFAQDYERRDLPRDGKTVAWCYPRGSGSWQARFAPSQRGTYTARARLRDASGKAVSDPVTFQCVGSAKPGFLRPGGEDPRFLEFSDGRPFFAIGQNLAFIGSGQYVTVPKAEQIFGRLSANGANFVRIWTCCKDWALAIEARKSAWTRSWHSDSPIVPCPDGRGRCILLEGEDGTSVAASPSHRVALKPQTSYVLSGRVRMEDGAALRIRVGGADSTVPAGSGRQRFEVRFRTARDEYWLGRTTFQLAGAGKAWLDEISLKEVGGGPKLLWEADVNRPVRGRYNPLDCYLLDQIVEAAEEEGIYLMLCLITRDLYMDDLSNEDSGPYRKAIEDVEKLMRYAMARWGYSTSVAAWEYFNEMDPGKPTDQFYAEVGKYLARIDPYRHLRTTSTWHPSARDCRHPHIDVAQEHHYMRPDDDDFRDEVESIVRQSRWLREHAPGKPALIGEFGLATPKWGLSDYMKRDTEGVHFHNCLWASAFSGVSGTAMFWWWEHMDQQDAYRHYKPLSAFLANLPPHGLEPTTAAASDPRIRLLGYQSDNRAALWLVHCDATWWNVVVEQRDSEPIDSAVVTLPGLTPGSYTVLWWDTWEGDPIRRDTIVLKGEVLEISVPPFTRDVACRIIPGAFAD